MGDLRTKVLSIGHTLCLTTDDPDVKVFVKDLRSTEALGIGSADVDILRGVVAQGSTGLKIAFLTAEFSSRRVPSRTLQRSFFHSIWANWLALRMT